MRIDVDWDRCEGHGLCTERAPELFELDDDGVLQYRHEGKDLPEDLQSAAKAGASVCPVAALTVVE